ncbi:MAG TPA: ABC transporter permease [Microbacteriaceae bacterium]|nr:ABC transporter permease [Microbacteriaceae bacterium]
MNTRDLIRSAFRNAFRSRLRTTLTALSLFVGAFTLTLTTALGAGVNDYVTRQVAAVGSDDVMLITPASQVETSDAGPATYDPNARAKSASANPLGSGSMLNAADIDNAAGLDGIDRVEPIRPVVVDWISSGSSEKFEVEVNPTSSIGQSDLIAGVQLNQTSSEPQIVLPDEYVDALGAASASNLVGSTVTIGYTASDGSAKTADVTVVGVARASLLASGAGVNTTLSNDIADAQAIPGQPASYSVAVAYLSGSDGAITEADISSVKAELAAVDLAGQTLQDQLGVVQAIISGIVGVLNAFAIVALFAASFGIVNTLLMSVQERTREIGLMKAMGMPGRTVFGLFSLEAVVIGLIGSVSGALAAIGLGSLISAAASSTVLADLPGLTIMLFQPSGVLTVIVLIMVIAFVSAVLPARRAARQDPITSLRYE